MSEEAHLVDEYELLNCIATGATTQIWEVMEQGTSRRFAMKLMLPEAYASFSERSVLKHEAKVGQAVEHPNIIQFQHFSLKKPYGYILMEYFRALNIKAQLRSDLAGLQSRLKRIVEGVCQGLAVMHDKGWIHMDIKPENLLANKSGEVKIIDFSLAKRPGGGLFGASKKKPIRGTRTYLAPETIRRKPPVPATDLYSLGISMYEVMTGSAPFSGASPDLLLENHLIRQPAAPSKINENITPEGDAIVLKLLNKRPEDRFVTAHELYTELRKINLFKQEPLELKAARERELREQEAERLNSMESKLDSRADVLRVQKGLAKITQSGPIDLKKSSLPETDTPKAASKPQPVKAPPASPPPGQSGQFPMPPGQPMPMPPGVGQPYPAQPYLGQPYPNQPYPNPGYPGQIPPPPGAGYPNQPYPPGQGYPPQGLPGQPYPGMPVPPSGQPAIGQSPGQQPVQQNSGQVSVPAGQEPPPSQPNQAQANVLRRPTPPPVPEDPGEDLPEMDELPPVS
ncbi:MAG: protein kinase [Planctomycetaceae bacterium]|nr:protein kinase [Planctomycetaceae bacterium]